jgi:glycosyltransferase involved in cell wall biosynthesis
VTPSTTVAQVATADITLRYLLLNQFRALQAEGFAVAGISGSGEAASGLRDLGIRWIPVEHLNRQWNPFADVRAFLALWRLFRRERFVIVHTHAPKTGVLGRLAARLAGVPIVVNTVHGLYGIDRGALERWFFLTMERLAAKVSDYEFCQSREDLDLLRQLGIIAPARSAYLGNGVNLDHFDPSAVSPQTRDRLRADLGLPADAIVVGTVGRLVAEKGYREFIDAAEQVKQRRFEVVFLAIGPSDGTKEDALGAAVIRRGEAAGVRFLGMRTDMRELYSLMDLFVLASYREGFPRSAIEAAAMGKALVLTDIRGCREVVTPGYNGILVPVRQAAPLAQAITALLDNERLRRQYGEASRARALLEFDERRIIGSIVAAYRDLLARKMPAGVSPDRVTGTVGPESPAE